MGVITLNQYQHGFRFVKTGEIPEVATLAIRIFILTIPFFLSRYGIKNVMLISIVAWMLRFGLFAYGDPTPF
ncbi:hypothetical protein MJM25_11690, partial [Salmonella enterica subsp. enterica serovar Lubbock]|nr:hypothetical protein [Salmonella enterica subsp. enterica serovar Lubbock]